MNTETGQVYRTEDEIEAARQRGEPLVRVSHKVAQMVEYGGMVMKRREWKRMEQTKRKKARKK